MKDTHYRAHIALFFVNVLYGAGHLIAKGVMPAFLSPSVFIFLRVSGAVVFFWTISLLLRKTKIQKNDIPRFIVCGIFGVAMNQLFFFHGLNLSSSINSGIIMSMNPIMVAILSFFLLKEKPTLLRTCGILIGATGAVLLTLQGSTQAGESVLGDVFLFINAICYAFYLVLVKPLMSKYAPITVITWVFTFGLFFVCIFPSTIPDLIETNFLNFPMGIYLKILYIVVGVTFLTYLLTIYGLKYLSPTISSSYIYFQPVLVVVFAFLFSYLHWSADYTDTITLQKMTFMFLIFTGVYLTSISSKKTA
ncbi:MAG: DMT family transporter [Crocinitomicaceae bacterium]|jgi:drug/metabolite transporter (DMT)-like permease|tara:strand:- start:7348 stop:8265 length:918 start_codon:yes stop_codon:yes gene_type:complete